ncbi:MAG: CRTAC1 family protein [Pirellulaceae bacterium]|nr:CRTAC1 family protein [Pirellulaceae bacterium]
MLVRIGTGLHLPSYPLVREFMIGSHRFTTLLIVCLDLVFFGIARGQFRDASEAWGFSGGGKAAFADFDNDGWVDVYSGELWRNEGGKKFSKVADSGLTGGEGIWGDYDNDGNVDLFLFTGSGSLYQNQGNSQFKKIDFPTLPTINSRGAVWFDHNNDALLDLFVGGYEIWQQKVHPDVVYLNRGGGKFEEVWRSEENFSARGVAAADFNEDGFCDIFVSNYRLQPNFLYTKDSTNGLTNVAVQKNAAGILKGEISYTGGIKYPVAGHTIGSCFDDLDNDGHIDLFVGNFSHPRPGQDHPQFLKNQGPGTAFQFEDRSKDSGLDWQESFASPTFGDFDNDGLLDLFFTTVYAVGSGSIRNYPVIYRNLGDWKFKNITDSQNLGGLPPTYQAAWADVDNDGDLDLCTAGKLFLNERKTTGNWIGLKVIGDGKRVNRTGIGAIVRITDGDQTFTRHVTSGTGEGNQNDLRLHIGLGEWKNKTVRLEVAWPGKLTSSWKDLDVNKFHICEFGKENP